MQPAPQNSRMKLLASLAWNKEDDNQVALLLKNCLVSPQSLDAGQLKGMPKNLLLKCE